MIVRQRTPHLRAIQWTGDNLDEVTAWLNGKLVEHRDSMLVIQRRSGRVFIHKGEYIVSMEYDLLPYPAATFGVVFEEVRS